VAAGDGTLDPGSAPANPLTADPWQAFGVYVLAGHRRRDFPAVERSMCVPHGVLETECPIRGFARRLGLLPDP
jgi:hypothetical protein